MRISRFLTLGGLAGPVMFTTTVFIVGLLRHSYDHSTQFISELGETGGEHSNIMNYFGFMIPAILILVFALKLLLSHSKTKLTYLASILVVVFSAGMFLAGFFSCDPTCLPFDPSTNQLLHNLVSFLAFVALITSSFLWGKYFKGIPEWHRFANYSLVTSGLAAVFLLLMILAAPTRTNSGLYQRFFLAVLFIWMANFAYRLWSNNRLSQK